MTLSKTDIFGILMGAGFSEPGARAIIGNIWAESGGRADNVEDRGPYSDELYTKKVKDKTFTKDKFSFDALGYGLCQWTYYTRKQAMYDRVGYATIDDPYRQIDFMIFELKTLFQNLDKKLRAGKESTEHLTREFCRVFENPANQSEAEMQRRISHANFAAANDIILVMPCYYYAEPSTASRIAGHIDIIGRYTIVGYKMQLLGGSSIRWGRLKSGGGGSYVDRIY